MIRNERRQVILECDSCGNEFNGEIDEQFNDVLASAKREGWTVAKIANTWLHSCANCPRPS